MPVSTIPAYHSAISLILVRLSRGTSDRLTCALQLRDLYLTLTLHRGLPAQELAHYICREVASQSAPSDLELLTTLFIFLNVPTSLQDNILAICNR